MPSPSKKPPTNVRPVPGTIVWVRRRNGSWWPGRIISKKELLASNVMSPRSGTPVKLLGRDDASVDWYNIEKSKRVKPFRCGEFDDCIEKAQAMAGQSKRREKYARREDAIIDAIELEKEQIEQLKTVYSGGGGSGSGGGGAGGAGGVGSVGGSGAAAAAGGVVGGSGTGGKKSKHKGKQKQSVADGGAAGGGGDQTKKPNGDGRKASKKKSHTAKDREASDLDDGPASLPRMRGLQDLVSAGTSSKITTVEGLDGSSEVDAPLLAEMQQRVISPDAAAAAAAKALKRKRSSGRTEDAPSKRRDRKRPMVQVLETLEQNQDGADPAKPEAAGGEGEDKLSDECESTQDQILQQQQVAPPPPPPQEKPAAAAHFLDAHSASYNGKEVDGTTALPSHTSAASPTPTGILQQEEIKPVPIRREKTSKKKALMPPRTLASLGADAAADVQRVTKQKKIEQNSAVAVSRLDNPSTASVSRGGKGKFKIENEETLTACCPPEEHKETWKEGFVHPRTRYEKQPVPVVSLSSIATGKMVCGYPVSVDVVDSIPVTRKKRLKSYYGESPKPWQTAKRTARQRTPRSEILTTSDDDYTAKVPGTGKKRSKEALSKKLLRKAVLTSKKIRTLASISEEKRRQPDAGFGVLSSKAPPKWPVATLVPVTVALNRLRGVVCS